MLLIIVVHSEVLKNIEAFSSRCVRTWNFFDVSNIVLSKVCDNFGVILMCETTQAILAFVRIRVLLIFFATWGLFEVHEK